MKPVELLAVMGGLDIKLFEDGSGVMRIQFALHHEGRDAPPGEGPRGGPSGLDEPGVIVRPALLEDSGEALSGPRVHSDQQHTRPSFRSS